MYTCRLHKVNTVSKVVVYQLSGICILAGVVPYPQSQLVQVSTEHFAIIWFVHA